MKNTGILIGIACCIIVAGLTTSKSVFAGVSIGIYYSGNHHGHSNYRGSYGKSHGHHDKGHHNYANHYSYGYRYKQYRHRHGHHAYGHSYGRPHKTYGRRNYKQGKSCRPVSKYSYDDYGNQRKIGGTMCYDSYGEGYIVEGSRYHIR